MFVFFCSIAISAILAMSSFAACLVFMLILHDMKGVGSWACIISSYFPMGLDGVLAEVLAHPTHWSSTPIVFFSCLVCGLLVIISAMLAHWAYYLFP